MLYDEAHEIDGEYYADSECVFAEDLGEYILDEDSLYCETDMLNYSMGAYNDGDLIEIEGFFYLVTDELVSTDEDGEWFVSV